MKSRNSSSTTLVDTPAAALKVAQNNKRGSSSLKNRGKGVVKEGGGGEGDQSEQQVHIWTERERRKRMRTMFTNLQALLPQLPSKAGGGSCGQFPESSLSVEDTFKLAAGEMNLWLLSC
ncbi:unnamed protein product [Linum tenue]|uniref:BHLH domain-containing protein n=1 Tax=Linum tenue TaxID=586396 RepID=A0AAV0KSH8_9ROSI|nr:unnamed protein product [Linum tenue]